MGQVSGEEPKETHTLDSGEKEELMAMEFTLGSMGIAMKASLKIVSSMDKELSILRMETHTKEIMSKENLQDMENIIGLQEVSSKEILRQG